MTTYIINEVRLEVPDDMEVVTRSMTFIQYKGQDIQIFDGRLYVFIESEEIEAKDLHEARRIIDDWYENCLRAFDCKDCDANTHAINEYYMVTDDVWAAAGMSPSGGMLCIGCLEKRIGRQLVSTDFPAYPINEIDGIFAHSERLISRITCSEIKEAA